MNRANLFIKKNLETEMCVLYLYFPSVSTSFITIVSPQALFFKAHISSLPELYLTLLLVVAHPQYKQCAR